MPGLLPNDLAEGYCVVNNRFNELAPSGAIEREAERWDLARLREREALSTAAGRVDVNSVAVAPDGEVVAMSELFINTTSPHRAFQGGTVVLPGHRGHRLGLALKVANHVALLEAYPDVEWIVTGNADVNAAMNAINERLGFRIVERCLEVHRAT